MSPSSKKLTAVLLFIGVGLVGLWGIFANPKDSSSAPIATDLNRGHSKSISVDDKPQGSFNKQTKDQLDQPAKPHDSEYLEAYIKALSHHKDSVRRGAALTLFQKGISAKPALGALVKAFNDSNKGVRMYAAKAVGKLGADALPALRKTLSDPNENAREASAQALAKMGQAGEPAIPALIKALGDPSDKVRDAVMMALAGMGPVASPAIPALATMLEGPSRKDGTRAANALRRMGPKGAALSLASKRKSPLLSPLFVRGRLQILREKPGISRFFSVLSRYSHKIRKIGPEICCDGPQIGELSQWPF
ncbi:MAG: HEAT repeat domain-containing protein [Planctomycetota bacterium]|nr:HEAT repeat domain-containing protein [Planctomycetota bacterium]